MKHGGVTSRHRLTIHANLLSQSTGDARLRIRELDVPGPSAAGATHEAPLRGRCVSRDVPPTAGRPTSDPDSIARGRCVSRSRCRRSAARRVARCESPTGRFPSRPSLPREVPTAPGSTYNRVAIPPVLPCWLLIKREHRQFRMATWDRDSTSRPPSRPPSLLRSAQAAAYCLRSLYSIGEQPFFGFTIEECRSP
jgi:hypothetical protein